MFNQLRFNTAFPNASRAGLKGFTGSLNFMISALLSRHISNERLGKPDVEESIPGNEVMAEQEDNAAGRELEQAQREEQGHVIAEEPLIIAARLKSIYDWVANELLEHARKRVMPDDSKVPDPFHLATTIENSLDFRVKAPIRVNEAEIKLKAEMYGLQESEIRDPLLARGRRQQLATARDAERIVELYNELVSMGSDGHELEAEASFERLHPLYQTRVLVSLDKALFNAYKQAAADDVSGTRADAAGDAVYLNGQRWDVRKTYNEMCKNEKFKRELDTALATATTQPAWAPEPRLAIVKKAA